MNIALIVFWFSVFLLAYTYALFTVLLVVRAVLRPRPVRKQDITPTVSMVVAVYNEAASIEAKLNNILTLDYPADRFQAVIVSDGSDDGTNEIAARFAESDPRITFIALPRQGKAPALNTAIASVTSDILVFSDANSMYAADALRILVRPFADPAVGGVAGDQRYVSDLAAAESAGEKSYWDFDRQLKLYESQGGHTISATGAIYAIRRTLFQGVPTGVTDDFVTSTRVIAQGYRLVFEPDAVAYEAVATSQTKEFARKVRVMTRGLNAVVMMRELLNPFRYGFYALQLFTHKVLRRVMYIPLIAIFLANPFLLDRSWFYQLAWIGQLGFYGLALAVIVLNQRGIRVPKVFSIPAYFCMVYVAAMLASWNVLRGHRIEKWSTTRAEDAPQDAR